MSALPKRESNLFRPRGALSQDSKYATAARVMTIQEMLSYRDTWTERLTPNFDLDAIIAAARTMEEKETTKLPTSESGFKIKAQADRTPLEKIIRSTQSLLNKLTEKNFEQLVPEMLVPEILQADAMAACVKLVFAKALEEPIFCKHYARLVVEMAKYEKTAGDGSGLRIALVTNAQTLHEANEDLSISSPSEDSPGGNCSKLRKRKISNIRFVAELYSMQLLSGKILVGILASVFDLAGKTPPELDAEVALELLNSCGKQLDADARHQGVLLRVWTKIIECGQKKPPEYSNRVWFLFMNLIDLRKSGWVRKDEPAAAEVAPEPQPVATPTHTRTVAAVVSDETAGGANNSSVNKSPLLLSSSSTSALDTLKNASLALPPPSINTEIVKRRIIALFREAMAHNDTTNWSDVIAKLSSVEKEPEHVSLMSSVFVLSQHACGLSNAEQRNQFSSLLQQHFRTRELARGFAWCLTRGIMDDVVSDVPHFFVRFVSLALGTISSLETLVKDVFARAANYLDAVYELCQGSIEWDARFVQSWELFIVSLAEQRKVGTVVAPSLSFAEKVAGVKPNQPKSVIPIATFLDALGSVRQSDFMRRVVPDMVGTLTANQLCNLGDLTVWTQRNVENPKVAQLVTEIKEMFDVS